MKTSLLATLVAGIILSGCGGGSDNNNSVDKDKYIKKVQAFDGAIRGMKASFTCDNGDNGLFNATTNDNGYISVSNKTLAEQPEICSIVFTATESAVDMSNGKPMTNVSYTIPRGLMTKDKPAAATPFTTLIAKVATDTTPEAIKEAEEQVFTDLGFGSSLTEEQKTLLLSEPQKALDAISPELQKEVMATTIVLSDTLVATQKKTDVTIDDVIKVTNSLSEVVVDDPNFPTTTNDKGETVPTYIDITTALEKDDAFDQIVSGDTSGIEQELTPVEGKKPELTPPPATGGAGTDNESN
ncbi:excinuclease ATPase subunit [Photobacterium leiognathi]|uniref:excinuclease ATPase subunit n=1 Tax=Photobacterium leiognathi TaxID=553611 RepID=UPI002980DD7A|nr:excinuclease ATPase subunit [Photobacterium leiognathi]